MAFTLQIKNVGKEPEFVKIWDNGKKREVRFSLQNDAIEACRIIGEMRKDTAFEHVNPIYVK